ncbi:MAG: putative polysaccharide biosynthesis protein [Bacillota bacterium]
MERQDSILKGTALLTGAGLVVKILGAAYRIPLSRLIGSEGIGLYQMAYPIYLMFLSLSTAGLPIAISKMIAEASVSGNTRGIKRIFRVALLLMSFLGLGGFLAMLFSAAWIANQVVADPRAVFAMWALAPSIFFMSLMAAFRGYFQGRQLMAPSAVSQIIEQTVRVGVALILVVLLLKAGIEHAAAGAAFGATAGGGAGLLFLILMYWRKNRLVKSSTPDLKVAELFPTAKRLFLFALPISLAVILMPLLQTIDSIIVPAKLQNIGYTVKQATSMLGLLGNSWAVMYVPMIVTGAISSNLVPAIAASKADGFKLIPVEKIREGLRMALYYLIWAGVLLYIFGRTVYRIIYGAPGVEILSWLAPAVVFLGLEQVSAGILQGLGKPQLPLLNFIAGVILKLGVTQIATGLPGLNLAGAALGTVCGSGLTAFLNLRVIQKLARINYSFLPAGVLAGITLLIGGIYFKIRLNMHYLPEMLLIGTVGTTVYLVILWLGGGIGFQDLELVKKNLLKRRSGHGYGDAVESGK